MLEAAVLLELGLGKYIEAGIIALLAAAGIAMTPLPAAVIAGALAAAVAFALVLGLLNIPRQRRRL